MCKIEHSLQFGQTLHPLQMIKKREVKWQGRGGQEGEGGGRGRFEERKKIPTSHSSHTLTNMTTLSQIWQHSHKYGNSLTNMTTPSPLLFHIAERDRERWCLWSSHSLSRSPARTHSPSWLVIKLTCKKSTGKKINHVHSCLVILSPCNRRYQIQRRFRGHSTWPWPADLQ